VKTVKPSEIIAFLKALGERYEYSTVIAAYRVLCGLFDLAEADGMVLKNPARAKVVPRPHGGPKEREPWTAEQTWDIILAHPEQYRLIPIITVGCGLRQGEVLGLAIEDIDFENKRVHIRRQLYYLKRCWYFKLPKRGKERTVPLPDWVARAIEVYIKTYPPMTHTLPWLSEEGRVAKDDHQCGLLFRWDGVPDKKVRRTGGHVPAGNYNLQLWKPALAEAGIIAPPIKDKRGRMVYHMNSRLQGTHALRHVYTTVLMDAGVSLVGIMEFLGHSKKGRLASLAPVTLGTYGHVTENTYEAARTAVAKALFRLRPVPDGTETEQRAVQ
jgi:integrase